MKSTHTLIFFALLILCQNLCAQDPANNSKTAFIDSLIKKKMDDAGIVGMASAIIINKKLAWARGYGYADRENKTLFTPSTIMNIGSISKTFTGVCIMKAVEEGNVSLDEDINHYLPFKVINPNYPNQKITLRHLATHTSGLADRYPFYEDSTYFYGKARPVPLDSFLKDYFLAGGKYYSKDNFLNAKPGSNYEYSNIGAGLAGYIIERRTGKKLNAYAKQHIFKPLKMKNSGWFLNEVDTQKHAKLYLKDGDTIKKIPWYENITYPDGGVRTSVNELSAFFICLLNEGNYNHVHILKKESADEMLRFQFTASNKPENIQLTKLNSGIFWATKLGATRMGHNGSDPGVRTFMLSDLSKEIGVVLFFNTSLSEKEESKFFDIYTTIYKYAGELKSQHK